GVDVVLRGNFRAAENVADLRAVAVGQHDLMACLNHVHDDSGRIARTIELLIDVAFFRSGGDGVPAESNDELHWTTPQAFSAGLYRFMPPIVGRVKEWILVITT